MTQHRGILCFPVLATALLFLPLRTAAQWGTQRAGSEDDLLAPGNPPLTAALVDKEAQRMEWLLDVRLTPQQRAQFQDALIDVWNTHREAKYLNLTQLRDEISQKTPEEQDLLREGVRAKFLAGERQKLNDPFARWVVHAYDSGHPPIAAGNPPLTAHVADAYADLVAFIINESYRRTVLRPNRQFKDLVTRGLAAEYGGYSAQQQDSMAELPFLWKELRYVWPRLSEAQRNTFRQQWTPMVASLASGAPGGAAAASNGNDASVDAFFARKAEHMSLQPMFNSSFNSTLSMHLNMFH